MKKSHFYLGILICISILWACNNASDTVTNDAVDEDTIVRTDTLDSKNGVTETMFTIPSPFETALLLQRAGAVYNAEILNPSDKWADYTTDISKGLNLGVYSADLCFTTIFDQTETSCKYIASCKKLAEELSIMDAISKNTLDRMEANTNHKDSLLRIISEVLLNSDSFLKENERTSTAAIVLAGGWIEGLYIGTQIAKNTKDNKELINRIADQRFSLETLMCLLEEQKEIDANVEPVLQGIKKINDAFCKIEINKAPVEVITDTTLGKTTLNSATTVTVSPEVFNEICNSAESLRTNIVKGELI